MLPSTFPCTGQRQEPALGFYYYKARWYDPALGRFMQADTLVPEAGNPISMDRYGYVSSNPANLIDPSGHVPIIDVGDVESDVIWLGWYTEAYLNSKFQSQRPGYENSCATFSNTMAINVIADWQIDARYVVPLTMIPHEIPGGPPVPLWLSPFGLGLTPPDQARLANELLDRLGLDYFAEFDQGGTVGDLIQNLERGYPTVVSTSAGSHFLGYPKNPIGHAMFLVGYHRMDDELIFLDPWKIPRPGEDNFIRVSASDFEVNWINQPNWFIPSGSMVIYRPK